jgi:hypothetical protein
MEKNAATVCLHDLTGLLRDLQEHLIELEFQADQATEFEQRLKFTGVCFLGLFPCPIFAPAQYSSSFAFTTVSGKGLGSGRSFSKHLCLKKLEEPTFVVVEARIDARLSKLEARVHSCRNSSFDTSVATVKRYYIETGAMKVSLLTYRRNAFFCQAKNRRALKNPLPEPSDYPDFKK